MRITKVYTKTGDGGTTRLVGGRAVPKSDVRIEAYGTVDELNSVVGLARTFNSRSETSASSIAKIDGMLAKIQNDLFCVGADLATLPEDRWEGMDRLSASDIERLEGWIDELNDELPELREFILPGGGPVGSFLHQARTICRRAERVVVILGETAPDSLEVALPYLNRLSDYLFVLSRWAVKELGEPEYLWSRD
ncbi:MAG: cob(I)yrinic acid a,c-diamide adenosyltransferase [Myxococcota bacterium]